MQKVATTNLKIPKKLLRKSFKWLGYALLGILLLFATIVLLIRTQWAQTKIIGYAAHYYQNKTGTALKIEKLYLTFNGDLLLKGLYAVDQKGDTLVYSQELQAGLSFKSLIDGNIHVSAINWNSLKTRINRAPNGRFSFDYIIDAFASEPQPADTSQSSMPEISIAPILFQDFDLHYLDSTLGMNAHLLLGKLTLKTDDIDLNNLHIALDELVIENTQASLTEFSPSTILEEATNHEIDTSTSADPIIEWQNISLQNVDLSYKSLGDSIKTHAHIGYFLSDGAKVDLGLKEIDLQRLQLSSSDIQLQMLATNAPTDSSKTKTATPKAAESFVWPDWKVAIAEVLLEENHLVYNLGIEIPKPQLFDADHLELSDFELGLKNIKVQPQLFALDVANMAFKERSGFEIKQFETIASFGNEGISAQNLNLQTAHNRFLADLSISYPHIDSLMADVMKTANLRASIKPSSLSIKDAFYFDDSLQYDSLMLQLAAQTVQLSGEVSGFVNDLNLAKVQVNAFENSQLNIDAQISGLPNIESLLLDIPNLQVQTNGSDLAQIAAPQGMAYPKSISLNSKLKGSFDDLLATLELKTSDGNATLKGQFSDLLDAPRAKGQLIAKHLNAAKYAENQDLAPVSFNMEFDASGSDLKSLVISSKMQFQQLAYNQVDYSKLNLQIDVKDQNAVLAIEHHQDYLDFTLLTKAFIDEVDSKAEMDLQLKIADLTTMKLDTNQLKMAFGLTAQFSGNADAFSAGIQLKNGEMKHSGNAFVIEPLTSQMSSAENETKFSISSGFANGKLSANESITTLFSSLESYLADAISSNSTKAPVANNNHLEMAAEFDIYESPFMQNVLAPGLTKMDTIKLSLDFKPAQDVLKLQLIAPNTVYIDMTLDSFEVFVDATNQGIIGKLSFVELLAEPVNIKATELNLALSDSNGQASFVIYDEVQQEVIYVAADITANGESKDIRFDAEHLTLNGEPWQINPENLVQIGDEVAFKDFDISRNKQRVSLQTDDVANALLVNFNAFDLAALTSILNAEQDIATGELNGKIRVEDIGELPAATANIQLNDLVLTDIKIGDLLLDVSNKGYDYYDLSLRLNGENINTTLLGNYTINESEQLIKAKLDIAKINMQLLEAFAPEYVNETAGYINGNFNIEGPVSDPIIDGSLGFANAKLTPRMLGTSFSINQQKIKADNKGLYFSNFTMVDVQGQSSVLRGTVGFEDLGNPSLNLTVSANNFQFLNAKKSQTEDYFGKGLVDIDAKIKGDVNLPKVNANLTLKSGTDITYEIPYTQAQIQEREGIVRFKNMKAPKSAFKDDEVATAPIEGIDLKTNIKIDPQTRFTIIIDPKTGDYLTVQGKANLSFNMEANGQMALVGKYEVNDGAYSMNLYELVKKEFDIIEGSSIVWTGDPLDADMDIIGEYSVLTSSVDLMANEIDLSNASTVNRYRQKLPFDVKLLIGGKILKPEIAFELDLPDNYKNTLDGTVYNRLLRLNENESELNLQVFSLIVFNKFLPSDVAAETGNRTSELARNSVSSLLSNQLNQLSDKYIKGVNLDFDLDSYTDYQSGAGQQRTDLNVSLKKNLFDDRLVLEVSSQVGVEGEETNSQVLGDISVEYLLTEDGQLRVKAYRENQFQDMVEGQVMITGLSILFAKEFDSVQELKKQRKEKRERRKEKRDENKSAPKGDAIIDED